MWTTYDVPDQQVVVARWEQRRLSVVFPIEWAKRHGHAAMVARARDRVAEVEAKAGRHLVGGSVLLAFARRDEALEQRDRYAPEVLARGGL